MIKLRQLRKADAPLMLEWMHDPEVQKGFQRDMSSIKLEDAEAFCEKSIIKDNPADGESLNFAIVNESDEYLGTISLKDIDLKNKHAEYAISMRRCAWGNGNAKAASALLLEKAFNEYGLNRVFLTVLADNIRARKLYEKCGFIKEGILRKHLFRGGEFADWCLYGILADEFANR